MAKSLILNGRRVQGLVKSIQRGTITVTAGNTTATATILAVDTANSRLIFQGSQYSLATSLNSQEARGHLQLTNSTTITATRQNTGNTLIVAYSIIEYWPGIIKSIQRGLINIAAAGTTNTSTITAVDLGRSDVEFLGLKSQDISGYQAENTGTAVLTNSTTVTFTRGVSEGTSLEVSYQVVEWN